MYNNQCQSQNQCPAPCTRPQGVPCGSPSECMNPNMGNNCSVVENVNLGSGQTFNVAYDTQGPVQQLTTTNTYNNYYRKFNHYYVTDYKYNNNYYAEYNVYHRTPVNITNGNYYLGTQNIVCTEVVPGNGNGNGNGGGCQPPSNGCQPPSNGCQPPNNGCQPPSNGCQAPKYNQGCSVRSRQCF